MNSQKKNIKDKHIPVLLDELVNSIELQKNKKNVIVDMTLWMWWHASKIIENMNFWDIFIWFDADIKNLELAKNRLNNLNISQKINLYFINSNFCYLKEELKKIWVNKISWIYYDLWLSSLHLDEADRWFSFMLDWPLDMRLDKTKWITASQVVNWYSKDELINIFYKYWELSQAKLIAEKIINARKINKFKTTKQLSDIVWWIPKVKSKIFQSIRIEVNKELENLQKSLNDSIKLLEKWWIIFVISFHSLEDRIVKNTFKTESKDCICSDLICSCKHKKLLQILTKKPITPSLKEIKMNSRSRSAKARYAKKI